MPGWSDEEAPSVVDGTLGVGAVSRGEKGAGVGLDVPESTGGRGWSRRLDVGGRDAAPTMTQPHGQLGGLTETGTSRLRWRIGGGFSFGRRVRKWGWPRARGAGGRRRSGCPTGLIPSGRGGAEISVEECRRERNRSGGIVCRKLVRVRRAGPVRVESGLGKPHSPPPPPESTTVIWWDGCVTQSIPALWHPAGSPLCSVEPYFVPRRLFFGAGTGGPGGSFLKGGAGLPLGRKSCTQESKGRD